MLPFEPESIEVMRARLADALERVWEVKQGMTERPGMYRNHMFDFEDGLRLLISKDKLVGQSPEIHVSASWFKNTPDSYLGAMGQVAHAYRSIGGEGELTYIGISENGIPHWAVMNDKERTH